MSDDDDPAYLLVEARELTFPTALRSEGELEFIPRPAQRIVLVCFYWVERHGLCIGWWRCRDGLGGLYEVDDRSRTIKYSSMTEAAAGEDESGSNFGCKFHRT